MMVYRIDEIGEDGADPATGSVYGGGWTVVTLTDSADYMLMCGAGGGGAYTVRISRRRCRDWMTRVGDLIDQVGGAGRDVLLVMSEAVLRDVERNYAGHSCADPYLREGEPRILVHSTALESWELIRREGRLRCWSQLKAQGAVLEDRPVGALLGDPEELRDYVMFGGGVTGEIVVSSRQRGRIEMDVDAEYLTGARLYFDGERIAGDGLLHRDGCHLKVRGELPLEPYLIWAADWENVGLPGRVSTPRRFAELADGRFRELFGEVLG